MKNFIIFFQLLFFFVSHQVLANQILTTKHQINYKSFWENNNVKKQFYIKNIIILGNKNIDKKLILSTINIKPNSYFKFHNNISNVILHLLKNQYIKDVQCFVEKINDILDVNLIFKIEENEIIKKYNIQGISKSLKDKLTDKVIFKLDYPASEKYLAKLKNKITEYFNKKGNYWINIDILKENINQNKNTTDIKVLISNSESKYINNVFIEGNHNIESDIIIPQLELRGKPRFTLIKDALWRLLTLQPFFKGGYIHDGYKIDDTIRYLKKNIITIPRKNYSQKMIEKDISKIIDIYKSQGYYDVKVTKTKLKFYKKGYIDVIYNIDEGQKYYIGNVSWIGNSLYKTSTLNKIFNFKYGDILNFPLIQTRIYGGNPEELDVLSLYQNNGYLTSNIDINIVGIHDNKVDLEFDVHENDIYKINRVYFEGNKWTKDDIIRRQIRVYPGQLYSKIDVMRSIRNLSYCRLFDPMKLVPRPIIHKDNTVDIVFSLKEKPDFKISGGLQGTGISNQPIKLVLKLGCNNLSFYDIFHGTGILGGGQNTDFNIDIFGKNKFGIGFSVIDNSFTNTKSPLGLMFDFNLEKENLQDEKGNKQKIKKIDISEDTSQSTTDGKKQKYYGIQFGIGIKASLDDYVDYSDVSIKLSYGYYKFEDYYLNKNFYNGSSHDICLTTILSRASIDDVFYPTTGSNVSLTFKTTPPYGWFKKIKSKRFVDYIHFKDYGQLIADTNFFIPIYEKFILMISNKSGCSYAYSGQLYTHKYKMGGRNLSGISSIGLLNTNNIPLRGYSDEYFAGPDLSIVEEKFSSEGAKYFSVFNIELRHPFIDISMLRTYLLAFFDYGNIWSFARHFKDFKKSIGIGFRFMISYFGAFGFDYGFGLDNKKTDKWEITFQIGI